MKEKTRFYFTFYFICSRFYFTFYFICNGRDTS